MEALVIGGGLAGAEAAWQLVSRGIPVRLVEMRPEKSTGAHHTDRLGELVCSNSLGGGGLGQASGLLKEELRRLGSLVIRSADESKVPAGGALAVDRDRFAQAITETLLNHPLVTIEHREMTELPPPGAVIASGPLTSTPLADALCRAIGQENLHFFDAAAPILTYESLDHSIVFPQSRYDKGEGVYLNCPMDREQYLCFHDALLAAEGTEFHLEVEKKSKEFFEGCLPIEVLARRGVDTLRYGPMKPVGLTDPRTGRWPYAVVQLRQDNAAGSLFNLVGFQNQLKWGEQKRVFRLIPGLEQAEFVRLGVMHRNTYLNSPTFLAPTLEWQGRFFAGQLIGVEGYTESTAMGLLAGINLARRLSGEAPLAFPPETILGALSHYICAADPKHFQPINSNWGLLPPLGEEIRDKAKKRELLAERSLATLAAFLSSQKLGANA